MKKIDTRLTMMSEPWEIFQRAWEHGFNIGYLQGYIPFIFTLNRYYYFSSKGVELEDVYKKLSGEGFFDWYLDRKVVTKNEKQKWLTFWSSSRFQTNLSREIAGSMSDLLPAFPLRAFWTHWCRNWSICTEII